MLGKEFSTTVALFSARVSVTVVEVTVIEKCWPLRKTVPPLANEPEMEPVPVSWMTTNEAPIAGGVTSSAPARVPVIVALLRLTLPLTSSPVGPPLRTTLKTVTVFQFTSPLTCRSPAALSPGLTVLRADPINGSDVIGPVVPIPSRVPPDSVTGPTVPSACKVPTLTVVVPV